MNTKLVSNNSTQRGDAKRQSNAFNWQEEMAALHKRTQELHLYEFWSVGKQGEHEAVRDLAKFDGAVPHIWKYKDIFNFFKQLFVQQEIAGCESQHLQPVWAYFSSAGSPIKK